MHAPRAKAHFPQRPAPQRVTRRRFLGGAAAAFGGLALGVHALPATGASPAHIRPAGAPAFDLHCHPGLFIRKGGPEYAGDEAVAKTVADMHTGGLAGGFFALVADAKILVLDPDGPHAARPFEPGEAW